MSDRSPELAALDVFVGTWTVQAQAPESWGVSDVPPGHVEFSWALDDRFLISRSAVPNSPVPSSMCIHAPDGDGYLQHYFDSRGVVRLYRMTLRDGVWELRATAEFSPLDIPQRFVGTFGHDGDSIEGRWEVSHDGGVSWELDFALTYTRVR